MRKRLLLFLLGMATLSTYAQRQTDNLDRGLVAVKTSTGIYCSWRITADEYYDVQYNIYRDGTKLNAEPLSVSNYTDKSGTTSSTYTVEPVVRGKVQAQSKAVKPWSHNYKEIIMKHAPLTSTYIPNDACVADVDGDGEVEILLKFDNQSEIETGYKPNGYNGEYAIVEVYKLDGTKLWWLDFGPNMSDFQNNENNIVAYDWDGDGKAEAVLRAADGTTIHMADGTTYVVGDASKNYRSASGGGGTNYFMHDGDEFLLYLEGATGKPYQCLEYPLKRLEPGETSLEAAWGDGYGHRSTKHFFGAPFLDGRKPSIFLARGIYTRHKMIALDVDPATHKLTERWRWNCNTAGSPWYGQGFHNFCIADVDWDGRDEIVFGAMVIDDSGKGLSTTGLGHGDSQHCGDFDPYTHGQEIFTCQEEKPNNCYRDGTTAKIYYRTVGPDDDGRALMGNFIDDIPGCQGVTSKDGNVINSVTHEGMADLKNNVSITQNFRIYWDGDLCSESFDYANGKNTAGTIYKARKGVIATLAGSLTNNDTKGTPCFQGDILGDWREEVIMRTSTNDIRIYTTDIETKWRNYTLWHDHQYRQAMVWQMCGYNQTPHTSYFLGELEGITVAPAPLTMTGRTEIANGGTIGSAHNDIHIIMCEMGDMNVSVDAAGASPYILTVNAPTWVQGHDDNNNITTTTYTHTITGGAFTGGMRLVKQGDGVLRLPAVTQTYTGPTDVWAGTLSFDGTMQQSRVWLNRHASLVSDGGKFKTVQADYNATVVPGGKDAKGSLEADSLILNFGSAVLIDLYSDGISADVVKAGVLKIEKKDWQNGPTYSTPVLRFTKHYAGDEVRIADGKYLIAEIGEIDGDWNDLKIEGLNSEKSVLSFEDGKLYVTITNYEVGDVTWIGDVDGIWNIDESQNFKMASGEVRAFVPGDNVIFDDNAVATDITIAGNVSPASITFNNAEKNLTLSGDSIAGRGALTKNGGASVTINNVNHIGNTTINGGQLTVASLANNIGQDYGSLGGVDKVIAIDNGATLSVSANSTCGQRIEIGTGGGTIDIPTGVALSMEGGFKSAGSGATLTKSGSGSLTLGSGNTVSKLVMKAGTLNVIEASGKTELPLTVEMQGGTIYDSPDDDGITMTANTTSFVVPEGCTGTYYADPRCSYTGKLTGAGTFKVYAAGVRNHFSGNWSAFEGTLVAGSMKRGSYDPVFDFYNSYGLAKATLQVEEGTTFNNNGNPVSLGGLSGSGILKGDGTYTIGSLGEDIKYSGDIQSPVKKVGTGTLYLSSSQKLTNATSITINEGTLYLNTYNSATTLTGDKSVTVNGGATVSGQGTLGGLTLNSGAELTPGRSGSDDATGFIATTGALKANTGSVVNLNIKSAANSNSSRSFIKAGTSLELNATVNVTLSDAYAPALGDEIILWTAQTFTGTPTVNLPELPTGFLWDDSALLQATGTLRVAFDFAGIHTTEATEPVRCHVYTLSGLRVCEFEAAASEVNDNIRKAALAPGTYIVRMATSGGQKSVKVVVE